MRVRKGSVVERMRRIGKKNGGATERTGTWEGKRKGSAGEGMMGEEEREVREWKGQKRNGSPRKTIWESKSEWR